MDRISTFGSSNMRCISGFAVDVDVADAIADDDFSAGTCSSATGSFARIVFGLRRRSVAFLVEFSRDCHFQFVFVDDSRFLAARYGIATATIVSPAAFVALVAVESNGWLSLFRADSNTSMEDVAASTASSGVGVVGIVVLGVLGGLGVVVLSPSSGFSGATSTTTPFCRGRR